MASPRFSSSSLRIAPVPAYMQAIKAMRRYSEEEEVQRDAQKVTATKARRVRDAKGKSERLQLFIQALQQEAKSSKEEPEQWRALAAGRRMPSGKLRRHFQCAKEVLTGLLYKTVLDDTA
jgi:hypothetical protein